MSTSIEADSYAITSAEPQDAECLISLLDSPASTERYQRLLSHIALYNESDFPLAIDVELLCKKCPVTLMIGVCTTESFDARFVDPKLCSEETGDKLHDQWVTHSVSK